MCLLPVFTTALLPSRRVLFPIIAQAKAPPNPLIVIDRQVPAVETRDADRIYLALTDQARRGAERYLVWVGGIGDVEQDTGALREVA